MNEARAEQTVREILALAGAMDTARLAEFLHDDVLMELPFAPPPLKRVHEGKVAVVDFQTRASASFASFSMTVDALHVTDAGLVVVAEHSSVGIAATTGREYRNRYVTVFELDADGRVRRWCEYYDPDAVRTAFM
jgi:ketosteroid isomerase-like protein